MREHANDCEDHPEWSNPSSQCTCGADVFNAGVLRGLEMAAEIAHKHAVLEWSANETWYAIRAENERMKALGK